MKINSAMAVRLEIGPNREWQFVVRDDVGQPEDQELGSGSRFFRWLGRRYSSIRQSMASTKKSWLKAVDGAIGRLESQIEPMETLLMQSRKADSIALAHPPEINSSLVARRFRRRVRRSLRKCSRGILINVLLLPVTAAMTPLPGPNVFFGWNAFRLISHYLAREGGKRILRGECPIEASPMSTPSETVSPFSA